MTVEERLREIIQDFMGVEAERIIPEANLVKDLGADSLDKVELVMAIEEEFGIDINDDDRILTFGDVVAFVGGKLK